MKQNFLRAAGLIYAATWFCGFAAATPFLLAGLLCYALGSLLRLTGWGLLGGGGMILDFLDYGAHRLEAVPKIVTPL